MNQLRIGGVDEAFNIPWKRVCSDAEFAVKNKLSLTWTDFDGGTGQIMRALNKGELDMAVVLTEGVVMDILQHDLARIFTFYITSPLEWGIHVSVQSGITQIAGLKNKTIAISRFGSGSHLMPMLMAHEQGWNPHETIFHESLNMAGGLHDVKNNTAQVFFWEKHTTAPFLDINNLHCIGSYFSKWPAFSVAVSKDKCVSHAEIYETVIKRVFAEAEQFSKSPAALTDIAHFYQMQKNTAAAWMDKTKWAKNISRNTTVIDTVLTSFLQSGLIKFKPSATQFLCA